MFGWFSPKPVVQKRKEAGFFSTPSQTSKRKVGETLVTLPKHQSPKATFGKEDGSEIVETGMDDTTGNQTIKGFNYDLIATPVLNFYSNTGFLGYQICAIMMQHWLVDKACAMPGRDAVRNGYSISINDGVEVDIKVIDAMQQKDKDYRIKQHMANYVKMGRGFGIRIAIYVVDSSDPKYYEKPLNLDGISPNSYKGIRQVDPYWCTPQFTFNNVNDPVDDRFYRPTFWSIGGKLYHVSHLSIYVPFEVPDYLKPSYLYGGVSVPQRIYQRIFAAETTADEAPKLAATKRMTVVNTDVALAVADPEEFESKIQTWASIRDNYGIKVAGTDEKVTQMDTTLTDMDNLIMTQYQIVAAIAVVPGTKLLGTQPKGFNSTGEYEEASYHEELESIQENDLTPMLVMHHKLMIKSDIVTQFNVAQFDVIPAWNALDAMTAVEQAELNLVQAQTDATLAGIGAIDGQDIRKRIASNPDSGYNGIAVVEPVLPAMVAGEPQIGPEGKPIPGTGGPKSAPEPLVGAAAAHGTQASQGPSLKAPNARIPKLTETPGA